MKPNPYESPESQRPEDRQASEPLLPATQAPATPGGYLTAMMVVVAAALVMAATIPGRTQGLALITKRLVDDIPGVTNESFAWINFWGTLIGGAFCLPCGWLLDRIKPMYFALVHYGVPRPGDARYECGG